MKITDITLEGTPEIKVYSDTQVQLDQVTITDTNAYDFMVAMAKAYYQHVLTTEGTEEAYKAIIEAVGEGIEIDILDDVETKVFKLRQQVAELESYLQDLSEDSICQYRR